MDKNTYIVSEIDMFPIVEEWIAEKKSVRITVSGNSMWPLIIHNRDSVLLEYAEAESLKRGDIILFHTPWGKHILHRITKVTEDGFITTGDGNLHRDGFVPTGNVIAKVTKVYRKEKEIDCGSRGFHLYSQFWMVCFPIRKYLEKGILMAEKCRGKLIRMRMVH